MRGHHVEWTIGYDLDGDASIFGQWIRDSDGTPTRFLTEEEIKFFLRKGGKVELHEG